MVICLFIFINKTCSITQREKCLTKEIERLQSNRDWHQALILDMSSYFQLSNRIFKCHTNLCRVSTCSSSLGWLLFTCHNLYSVKTRIFLSADSKSMSPFLVFAHSLFVFRFIAGFIRIAVSYVSPHCSLCCHSLLNFDLSLFFF